MTLTPDDLAALTQLEVLRMTHIRLSKYDWRSVLFRPLSVNGLNTFAAELRANHAFIPLVTRPRRQEDRVRLLYRNGFTIGRPDSGTVTILPQRSAERRR